MPGYLSVSRLRRLPAPLSGEPFLPPLKGEIPREGTRRAAVGARYLWDREAVERSLRCGVDRGAAAKTLHCPRLTATLYREANANVTNRLLFGRFFRISRKILPQRIRTAPEGAGPAA